MTTTDGSITVVSTYGPAVSSEGVLNGASLLSGAVAPGEVITILGSAIGAPANVEMRVTFDGFPAPLLYVASDQINAVVPFEIEGQSSTTIEIASTAGFRTLLPIAVAASAPAVFTLGGSGAGQGAILNQDSSINSPSNPAESGSIIVLFATGAGQTNPPGTDGLIATSILSKPLLPVSIQIGGADADILYAGAAPGMISGVLQVNCRIPPETKAANAIPVVLNVGGTASPPVFVAVK